MVLDTKKLPNEQEETDIPSENAEMFDFGSSTVDDVTLDNEFDKKDSIFHELHFDIVPDEELADSQKSTKQEKIKKHKSKQKNNAAGQNNLPLFPVCIILAAVLLISMALNAFLLFTREKESELVITPAGDNTPNVDTDTFPLLASVKEESLFLYGIRPYGVVLVNNGVASYFDWLNISDNMKLPEMYASDIDRDGINEIVILTKETDEAGESQDGVHVIEYVSDGENNPIYDDTGLNSADTVEMLKEIVDVARDTATGQITVLAGGTTYPFDHVNSNSTRNYLAAQIGRSVEYKMDGATICAAVSVDIVYDDGSYETVGTIETEFDYSAGSLTFDNTVFVIHE